MFPETTHTTNCIVRFWIRRCCWFCGPFSKSSFSCKIRLGFSQEDGSVLGTNFGSAKLKLLLLEKVLSPPLLFSVLYESTKMEGANIDPGETISVEEHLYQGCWDPISKSNNLEANLTTLNQTDLFPVSSPMFGIFC